MLGPYSVGSPYLHVSHTQHAMLGPCSVGSLYLHGLHAQHAMLGPYIYIQYSVRGPYIYMGLKHNMLCCGLIFSIVCGAPISTWVPCTICYAGAL